MGTENITAVLEAREGCTVSAPHYTTGRAPAPQSAPLDLLQAEQLNVTH